MCANLATERPLALVVDDADWADGASLRFLAFLLPRLEELHIAVLLGARPAEAGERRELLGCLDHGSGDRGGHGKASHHERRGHAGGVRPRGEPEPEFVQACWKRPAVRLSWSVRWSKRCERSASRQSPSRLANVLLGVATTTLARWAMLRLVQLGPDAARMARAVAVLERAELDQAAQLAGLALRDAVRAADLLVQAGVLDEASLGFAHPLLRGAVYQDMAMAERAEAHGRAARLLADVHASPGRVAEHLLATSPAGDGWVVEQLRAAGQEAMARGAPESATAYLRRALAEPPSSETRPHLLLELGLSEFSASESGWHEHLEDAVESARDDTILIAATLLLANALWIDQRVAEAVEVCDRVAERLDGREPDGHWSRAHGGREWVDRRRDRAARGRPRRGAACRGHRVPVPLAARRRWPETWRRWLTDRPTRWLIWPPSHRLRPAAAAEVAWFPMAIVALL